MRVCTYVCACVRACACAWAVDPYVLADVELVGHMVHRQSAVAGKLLVQDMVVGREHAHAALPNHKHNSKWE